MQQIEMNAREVIRNKNAAKLRKQQGKYTSPPRAQQRSPKYHEMSDDEW